VTGRVPSSVKPCSSSSRFLVSRKAPRQDSEQKKRSQATYHLAWGWRKKRQAWHSFSFAMAAAKSSEIELLWGFSASISSFVVDSA